MAGPKRYCSVRTAQPALASAALGPVIAKKAKMSRPYHRSAAALTLPSADLLSLSGMMGPFCRKSPSSVTPTPARLAA